MVITVAIVVAATLLTRFSAFLIFPPGKKAPDFVQYLGKALPAAVMGMLVVYTFKDTIVLSYPLWHSRTYCFISNRWHAPMEAKYVHVYWGRHCSVYDTYTSRL